jgi:hypothetical protein
MRFAPLHSVSPQVRRTSVFFPLIFALLLASAGTPPIFAQTAQQIQQERLREQQEAQERAREQQEAQERQREQQEAQERQREQQAERQQQQQQAQERQREQQEAQQRQQQEQQERMREQQQAQQRAQEERERQASQVREREQAAAQQRANQVQRQGQPVVATRPILNNTNRVENHPEPVRNGTYVPERGSPVLEPRPGSGGFEHPVPTPERGSPVLAVHPPEHGSPVLADRPEPLRPVEPPRHDSPVLGAIGPPRHESPVAIEPPRHGSPALEVGAPALKPATTIVVAPPASTVLVVAAPRPSAGIVLTAAPRGSAAGNVLTASNQQWNPSASMAAPGTGIPQDTQAATLKGKQGGCSNWVDDSVTVTAMGEDSLFVDANVTAGVVDGNGSPNFAGQILQLQYGGVGKAPFYYGLNGTADQQLAPGQRVLVHVTSAAKYGNVQQPLHVRYCKF